VRLVIDFSIAANCISNIITVLLFCTIYFYAQEYLDRKRGITGIATANDDDEAEVSSDSEESSSNDDDDGDDSSIGDESDSDGSSSSNCEEEEEASYYDQELGRSQQQQHWQQDKSASFEEQQQQQSFSASQQYYSNTASHEQQGEGEEEVVHGDWRMSAAASYRLGEGERRTTITATGSSSSEQQQALSSSSAGRRSSSSSKNALILLCLDRAVVCSSNEFMKSWSTLPFAPTTFTTLTTECPHIQAIHNHLETNRFFVAAEGIVAATAETTATSYQKGEVMKVFAVAQHYGIRCYFEFSYETKRLKLSVAIKCEDPILIPQFVKNLSLNDLFGECSS
jgi:hypothetical protein